MRLFVFLLIACGPAAVPGPHAIITLDEGPFPWLTLPSGAREPAGFGVNGVAWFRFDVSLDPASVTDAVQYFRLNESGLREVDIPFALEWDHPHTTLVVRPFQPLQPEAWHAVIINDRVRAGDGKPLGSELLLEQLKAGQAPNTELQARFDRLWRTKIDKASVRAATVFRSGEPLRETLAIAAAVQSKPAPVVSNVALALKDPQFCVVEGMLEVANFTGASGEIIGTTSERVEQIRFALSVPRMGAPPEGYPVILFAPGLGGTYFDFVLLERARALALSGFSVLSIDPPVTGPRHPSNDTSGVYFTAADNPLAARDNVRQYALDFLRLQGVPAQVTLPAGLCDPIEVHLDPARLFFWGHNIGAKAGALVLALANGISGGMLSGLSTDPFNEFDDQRYRARVVAEPIDPLLWARRWAKPTLVIVERERVTTLRAAAPTAQFATFAAPTGSTGAAVFEQPAAEAVYRCFFEALANGQAPACSPD